MSWVYAPPVDRELPAGLHERLKHPNNVHWLAAYLVDRAVKIRREGLSTETPQTRQAAAEMAYHNSDPVLDALMAIVEEGDETDFLSYEDIQSALPPRLDTPDARQLPGLMRRIAPRDEG